MERLVETPAAAGEGVGTLTKHLARAHAAPRSPFTFPA